MKSMRTLSLAVPSREELVFAEPAPLRAVHWLRGDGRYLLTDIGFVEDTLAKAEARKMILTSRQLAFIANAANDDKWVSTAW